MATVRRNIVFPEALDKELDAVAEMLGETKSNLVTRALSYYLDLIDLAVAKERARKYEASGKVAQTSAALKEHLGL